MFAKLEGESYVLVVLLVDYILVLYIFIAPKLLLFLFKLQSKQSSKSRSYSPLFFLSF